MKHVATIGGGTGHYTILRGLKNYNVSLDALVSVVDNGGSSGRLRDEFVEFGILPPGDIRNCLLALTDEAILPHIVSLFNYRFPETGKTLSSHNLGNLIIAACQNVYGKNEGIRIASNILGIKDSRVVPISIDSTNIFAKTKSGKILEGQMQISYSDRNNEIKEVWLNPKAFINKIASKSIEDADMIVICPGDLFGSIIPNFLVAGTNKSLENSKAKIVYVCNLVTKQGTCRFTASDFVEQIERYMTPRSIDYVICNTRKPVSEIVDKYRNENSDFVYPNLSGKNIIKEDLLVEQKIGNKIIARHDSYKTARILMEILEGNSL